MAAPRFGEWKFWEEGEPAPEGLLPCGYVQYRWVLNYQWPVDDDWFGVTGRLFSYIGNIEIGTDFVSEDRVVFVCTCLGLTPTLVIWTYYPGTLQTTGPETCETFGGPQLDWQYGDLGDVGIGIDTLFIEGNLVSPIYKLNLPADAQITDLMLRPQYAIAGAWELQVRTAPGKVAEPVLIIDNVSGDQHSLALHGDVLVDRRWLSAYRAWDGPRDGLEVTAGTNYVWVRALTGGPPVPLEVVVTMGETVPAGCPYLLAIVEAGPSEVTGVEEAPGSVVEFGVDSFGAAQAENGELSVVLDTDDEDQVRVSSGDRGLTWVRQQ